MGPITVPIKRDSIRSNPEYYKGLPAPQGTIYFFSRNMNSIPKLLYEHEDTNIPCSMCDHVMSHLEWEYTEGERYSEEVGDYIVSTACPVCGNPCVPFTMESL